MKLVLIEAGSKQRYIFESNKLAENAGASELVRRSGTDWVREAINDSSAKCQEVYCTSGKALIIAADVDAARKLVFEVTSRALCEAPGLEVYGQISDDFDPGTDAVAPKLQSLHRRIWKGRAERGSELARFARTPFAARCGTTRFPAAEPMKYGLRSHRAAACFRVGKPKLAEMAKHAATASSLRDIDTHVAEIDEGRVRLDWLGIVHIDGNGFGRLFTDLAALPEWKDPQNNARYLGTLRALSFELDRIFHSAFENAAQYAGKLVLPLVIAGDDMTFACDGRIAIPLAVSMLEAIEAASFSNAPNEPEEAGLLTLQRDDAALEALFGGAGGRLSACAGVALVKPTFPFWQGYDLASDLAQSAKLARTRITRDDGRQVPVSALDYHILMDGTAAGVDELRTRATSRDGTRLHARPLIVSQSWMDTVNLGKSTQGWAARRSYHQLSGVVRALMQPTSDRQQPPARGQLQKIRAALADSSERAEQVWQDWQVRDAAARTFATTLGSLVEEEWESNEEGEPTSHKMTRLLDAMELRGFLEPVPRTEPELEGSA